MTDARWDGKERRNGWRYRWQLAGPYLAVAVVVVVGFFVQGQNSNRIEDEAIARDVAICEDGNDRAAGVVNFVERLVDDFPLTPEAATALVTLAVESFPQQECPPAP